MGIPERGLACDGFAGSGTARSSEEEEEEEEDGCDVVDMRAIDARAG